MNIHHIALWTEDIERIVQFYVTYFEASAGPRYSNPAHGFASVFLEFGNGAKLEIMQTSELCPVQAEPGAQRMGLTHLAISVGSSSVVDQLTRRIEANGFPVVDPPRPTGDGTYERSVPDPAGNRIEITI